MFMRKAGSAVPSANRITLLRDADGDGVAEIRTPYITGPALALRHGAGRRARSTSPMPTRWSPFPTIPRATAITAAPRTITALPAQRNHHWTKSLAAGPDGTPLCRRRLQFERRRARHGRGRGARRDLGDRPAHRQPPPLRHRPQQPGRPSSSSRAPNDLYAVVNERDELGSDLVPDYLTRVQAGGFYGWPWSYYGSHVDTRVAPAAAGHGRAARIPPDYALGAHVAPLGLAFSQRRRASARSSPAAPSSACTARGTGARSAATRSSSCRFATAARRASRSTSSPASSTPRSTRHGPPGRRRRSPATARCWSRTMSATRVWRVSAAR